MKTYKITYYEQGEPQKTHGFNGTAIQAVRIAQETGMNNYLGDFTWNIEENDTTPVDLFIQPKPRFSKMKGQYIYDRYDKYSITTHPDPNDIVPFLKKPASIQHLGRKSENGYHTQYYTTSYLTDLSEKYPRQSDQITSENIFTYEEILYRNILSGNNIDQVLRIVTHYSATTHELYNFKAENKTLLVYQEKENAKEKEKNERLAQLAQTLEENGRI